eukprot:COSAG05_NODE_1992_length_3734_cov_2.706740_4_plen_50_part_00
MFSSMRFVAVSRFAILRDLVYETAVSIRWLLLLLLLFLFLFLLFLLGSR